MALVCLTKHILIASSKTKQNSIFLDTCISSLKKTRSRDTSVEGNKNNNLHSLEDLKYKLRFPLWHS